MRSELDRSASSLIWIAEKPGSPAILLVSGAMVMIGRVPLGASISSLFPKLADWIMSVPNAAGQRGMIIGAAMGVIATGLRVLVGIEKPYLKGE